jgi:hypothetical protein
MNKPAHPVAAKPVAYPAYDEDGYGWAMAQAAIIRAGRIDSIDWENVAEEIESMGKQERSEYISHMIRVMHHLIKWEAQPERRSISWWLSIMNGRTDAERVLNDNPSLKPLLEAMHLEALKYAQRKAVTETGLDHELIEAIAVSREDALNRSIPRPEQD